MFSFLQISSSKLSTHLDQIPTLILSSHQTLGPLSVLFPSDIFIKTLYTPRPNPHFNIILPSNSGPRNVLIPSDFFIKTLYTTRPNPHFNIILPSNSGPPKCSIPQISSSKHSTHLDIIPTLILSSYQTLSSLSVLFPSDFFIKTLYMPRQNTQFNIFLPTSLGSPNCSVSFKFLHQIPVEALTN